MRHRGRLSDALSIRSLGSGCRPQRCKRIGTGENVPIAYPDSPGGTRGSLFDHIRELGGMGNVGKVARERVEDVVCRRVSKARPGIPYIEARFLYAPAAVTVLNEPGAKKRCTNLISGR
jgi:hypothetical protein